MDLVVGDLQGPVVMGMDLAVVGVELVVGDYDD